MPDLQNQSIWEWEQRIWTCRESLTGVQCNPAGADGEGASVMIREGEGEGSQRVLPGEDTKLELTDCSGVSYTRDPGDGSRCGNCCPQLHKK